MRIAWAGLVCLCVFGQPPADDRPSFEVASVKVHPRPVGNGPQRVGTSGGPGSGDPTRYSMANMSAANLITTAYRIRRYQLSAPDWITGFGGDTFDIEARLAEGTSKEQLSLMVQRLLAERFGLKAHFEKKEMPTYDLVVAKGGPTFQQAAPPPAEEKNAGSRAAGQPKIMIDKDGFPLFPRGDGPGLIKMNGKARLRDVGETMDLFASECSVEVGRPVTNATGLTGKYDFELTWVPDRGMDGGPLPAGAEPASAPSGPTFLEAVQQQLGLRLDAKKGLVDILVVDHMEKRPAEN